MVSTGRMAELTVVVVTFTFFFLWSPGPDDVLGPLDVALPSFLLKEAFLYLAMKNIFLKQKY